MLTVLKATPFSRLNRKEQKTYTVGEEKNLILIDETDMFLNAEGKRVPEEEIGNLINEYSVLPEEKPVKKEQSYQLIVQELNILRTKLQLYKKITPQQIRFFYYRYLIAKTC